MFEAVTIDTRKTPLDGAYMIGDGIAYTGDDGELNTVMNKKVLFKKEERNKLFDAFNKLNMARVNGLPDTFPHKADSILTTLTKIDDKFIAGYPKFGWAIRNVILSEFYAAVCMYYWYGTMPHHLYF